MKLTRLEVHELPGIDREFVLDDIDLNANFVSGPNACGKSSLVRALSYLLGGVGRDDPPGLFLKAVFEGDQGKWAVTRTGPGIAWELNGEGVAPPPLPEADQLRGIWLSMESLLAADEGDQQLADELKRTLTGGCDLDALRKQTPFSVGSQHGDRQKKDLVKAERDLREVEAEYADLARDEEQIPRLEKARDEAQEAGFRVGWLEKALKLLKACSGVRKAQVDLEAFPEGMDHIFGREKKILEDLDVKEQKCKERLNGVTRSLEEAKNRLKETELAEERPESLRLQAALDDLQEMRRMSDLLSQKQSVLDAAEVAENEFLGSLGDGAKAPDLDPASVEKADLLVRDFLRERGRRDKAAFRCEEEIDPPEQAEIDGYLMAGHALREWLSAEGGPSRAVQILLLVSVVGGVVAAAVALAYQAELALVGGLLAAGGAAAALFLSRGDRRKESRSQFEASGIAAPGTWSREAVEGRLEEIDKMRQELLRRQEEAQAVRKAREELHQIEETLQELEQRRIEIAREVGFDPMAETAVLGHFVWLLREYQKARNEKLIAQEEVERLQKEMEICLDRVRDFLVRWCSLSGEESLNGLRMVLEKLRLQSASAEKALQDIRSAEREIEDVHHKLEELECNRKGLFTEAGLEPGDVKGLLLRCGLVEDWKRAAEAFREAKSLEAFLHSELEGQEEMLELAASGDMERLERELGRARGSAGKLEEIRDKLATINQRLTVAGEDQKLEKSLMEVSQAREALEEKHESALFADLSQMMLDGVEEEYQAEHEPEVLKDARRLFRRFTHSAFDFTIGEGRTFLARDLTQEASRNLSELSSATRMNLLLALRLAWNRHVQRGTETLPLILDEALTNSDESRFGEVVRSLDDLVRNEDMQVFYLSARRYESELWKEATQLPLHHIDLAVVRWPQDVTFPEDYALPEEKSLPMPEGKSPEVYASELGVLPVDPRQTVGSVHLFYLLRDKLSLLYRLLEAWHMTSLGQLESLLKDRAAENVFGDPGVCKQFQGRCAVVRAWFEAWRHGRGKIVDADALGASGVVSDNFMASVHALSQECSGDGALLIRGLRSGKVSRFRSQNMEDLESWLEENGYISSDTPWDSGERRQQTLLQTTDFLSAEEAGSVISWLEAGVGNS